MADKNLDPQRVTSERLLDLLLDALQARQVERQEAEAPGAKTPEKATPRPMRTPTAPAPQPREAAPSNRREPRPGDTDWQPPPRVPTMHLEKALVRFLALVAVLIVVVNVPVNAYGVSLARILPDSASLVIRDGLVLKGSGPEIYILRDDELHWISSMDAFEHLGLKWGDVHVVEDSFLRRFEQGRPIHVLLKCNGSPHIYRLENQQKRWIRDMDTFLAEGHVWDDVRFVSCDYLRRIPDGPPIPEDAGPPPQP